jgi:hypothetical protein
VHALHLCQNLLARSLSCLHTARYASLWFAVSCLLNGGRLTLTALGRAARADCKEKNAIKKIDRLLGNEHLWQEIPIIYRAVAAQVLGRNKRAVIAVDWTPWREGFHALTAGITVGGKCLVLYAEVHPEKKLGNGEVERQFLRSLKTTLPADAKPVIVTDGGFRTAWLDEVEALGWDFVGRVRGRVKFLDEADGGKWKLIRELHAQADHKPRCLGVLKLAQWKPRSRRIVLLHKPPKKRKARQRLHEVRGADMRSGHGGNMSATDRFHRKSALEPWLLVTSLVCSAREVTRIYTLRMQTEETYRGLKSHRFGWSFEDSRSTTAHRLAVLLLIGVLAALVVTLVGWLSERDGNHLDYQANTTRRRRVLSWFYLGIRVCLRERIGLTLSALREALANLAENAQVVINEAG